MNHNEIVFEERAPEFGVDYGPGWIGFNHASSWMSTGIAVVTRDQRERGIPISHAFVVTGEDECVEAAFRKGVVVSSLTEQYFDNPDRFVVFRRPKGLNDDLADRIVQAARAQVGVSFDNAILVGSLVKNSFLARTLDQVFAGRVEDLIARLTVDEDRWICSELAAHCLREQPEFAASDVLGSRRTLIEPQLLFEADELFDPLPTDDGK